MNTQEKSTQFTILSNLLIQFTEKLRLTLSESESGKNRIQESIEKVFETYTSKEWYDIVLKNLYAIYPDSKYTNFEKTDNGIQGGKCWLNPSYTNSLINNVINISFINLYPNTICKLYKKGELTFNNDKIGDLYCDIVYITKKDIKEFIELMKDSGTIHYFHYLMGIVDDKNVGLDLVASKKRNESLLDLEKYLWRYRNQIINRFYGMLASIGNAKPPEKSFRFECNSLNLITSFAVNFWDILIDRFKENICYVDTDMVYIKLDEDFKLQKMYDFFNLTELPYEKNWMKKNVDGNIFETILNSKLPENTINEIINQDRLMKLNSIFNEQLDNVEDETFICLFLRTKNYLVFDNKFGLIRTVGVKTFKKKSQMVSISNKINHGYKNSKWNGGLTLQGVGDTAMFQGQTEWENHRI